MLVLTFLALVLSMGSLQAQTQPNCDLSKCSPEERAACAKRCATTSALATTAGLTNFLFDTKEEKKPNCNPVACAKTTGATTKLVATETKPAPVYSNSLETVIEDLTSTEKKKRCTVKCSKAKTSL